MRGSAPPASGTPESVWLPFLDSLALPALSLSPPPRRVVLLAPHPDDEVLACGGLLALLASAGTAIHLVAVTDGEASNPGGSVSPAELAARRRMESTTALAALGLPAALPVTRLGRPDGGSASLQEPVEQALSGPVRLDSGDWLLAPWTGDGHPDHEAVGRAAVQAATVTGARLLAYPVWAWQHAHPADAPDTQPPWSRALQVPLPPEVAAAKARAVAAFASQIHPLGPLPQDAPVLSAEVLARFARPYEIVFGTRS